MRKAMLGLAATAAFVGLAGMGHNMPPVLVEPISSHNQAVLPRRIEGENRRNQKLKQKRRRRTRHQRAHTLCRAKRKAMRFGAGYRPGKLFKRHRI